MHKRSLLRSQLRDSWKKTIEDAYVGGLINSEHGLQVHFCIRLLHHFDEAGISRRIFVEPAIVLNGLTPRFPDLVICNSRNIIGVVEFKYVPRGKVSMKKDLDTLCLLGNSQNKVTISHDRFRGKARKKKQYPIVKDVVLCWAGVFSSRAHEKLGKGLGDLEANFLQLGAITREGDDPKIVVWETGEIPA